MKKTALKLLTVTTLISSIVFSPSLSSASEATDVSAIPRHLPTLDAENFDSNFVKEIPSAKTINQHEDVSKIIFEEISESLEKFKEQNNQKSRKTENSISSNTLTYEINSYDDEYEPNDTMDEAHTLYYSRYYPTYISAVLDDTDEVFDVDYYKFSTVSSNSDLAVTLEVPIGYNYNLWVMDEDGYGWASERGVSQNEIIRIPAPASGAETYYVVVLPHINFDTGDISPSNPNEWYRLKIDQLWENDKHIANVSPSTLNNPGAGYSNTGTVDLTLESSIPNTAQVTNVNVLGSLSRDLGNTYILAANTDSLEWREGYLTSIGDSHYIPGFNNCYDRVKSIWYVEYYTAAFSSSSLRNVQLEISYIYDQYENY